MRLPNPPRILIDGLTPESRRKVVYIGLQVIEALAKDQPYSAYEIVCFANLDLEEKLALASLYNSAQASIMTEMARQAHEED